ncbi:MAG: hypothetical protein ACJ8C4_15420 [Gemmataceae bacterium]
MTPPSGAIIARPMLKRACGCLQEFQYYQVDKFRAQRQAKFQSSRCPTCAAKQIEAKRIPPKAEALAALPTSTRMVLVLLTEGSWAGKLTAQSITVEAERNSPDVLIIALAQLWSIRQRTGH